MFCRIIGRDYGRECRENPTFLTRFLFWFKKNTLTLLFIYSIQKMSSTLGFFYYYSIKKKRSPPPNNDFSKKKMMTLICRTTNFLFSNVFKIIIIFEIRLNKCRLEKNHTNNRRQILK